MKIKVNRFKDIENELIKLKVNVSGWYGDIIYLKV